jgi:hypothetical protein
MHLSFELALEALKFELKELACLSKVVLSSFMPLKKMLTASACNFPVPSIHSLDGCFCFLNHGICKDARVGAARDRPRAHEAEQATATECSSLALYKCMQLWRKTALTFEFW